MIDKITEQDLEGLGVTPLPDVPDISADALKRKFEEILRDVAIPKINEIIEAIFDGGLPLATADNIGGILAEDAESSDVQPVRMGQNGMLYTAAGSGGEYHVDDELSDVSRYPVQNRIITGALRGSAAVNILDNADWGYALVNQRGAGSYDVTNGTWDSTIGGDYTIDRWITHGGLTVVSPTADAAGYITLDAGCVMKQRIELLPSALSGRRCCAAIDIDGHIYSAPVTFPLSMGDAAEPIPLGDSGVSVTVGFDSGTYTLCDVADVSGVPYIIFEAASSVGVCRVWLEPGSICHMEAALPMDYTTVLLRCERYYYVGGPYNVAFGFISNQALTYYMFANVPVPLRAAPTVTMVGWRGRKAATAGYLSYTGNTFKAPVNLVVNYSPRSAMVRIADTITSGSDENNQIAQYEFSSLIISSEL